MRYKGTMNLPESRHAAGIAYRESGKPESPALVLLHGIGSTSAVWRDQYAPLGQRRRVVAWSAPGIQAADLVRRLDHRVLFISGAEDVVTPPEKNARRLVEAARTGRLKMLEKCGHLPHVEKPGEFNRLVLDFVA